MKPKIHLLLLVCLTAVISFKSTAQDEKQRQEIISNYDLAKLKSMERSFSESYFTKKAEALRLAKINNWPITIDENGTYSELMYVSDQGTPIYYATHNVGAAVTARVNRINTGGTAGLNLNGQNMIVGIWDGGAVRNTHEALIGRVTYKDGETFSTSTSSTQHATHVSGTMMGSGIGTANGASSAKGLAFQANLWGNTFANDQAEVLAQVQQGLLVSNHSYGVPVANVTSNVMGAYTQESKNWDNITFNAPFYQPVISAGNDRGAPQDTKGGRDLLVGNKNSKNAVVVAAVNQVLNYNGPNSVVMSSFSSWGPTDDFRIKPDIATKGVGVFSLSSTSDSDLISLQGTSMAAPGVSASLLLMQQHYNALNGSFMRAATLRGVMVNAADEAGDYDGPDYKFGWGLINAERAVQIISGRNVTSIIEERVLLQGESYTRNVTAANVNKPLNVTVTWNDPSGNVANGVMDSPVSVLVNDLDVRVTKNGEIYFPWVLNPFFIQGGAIQDDNAFDNVENVDILNPSGIYTITVTHKGILQGSVQNYSLVVDGVTIPLNTVSNTFDKINVYPNPVTEDLNVALVSNDSEPFSLSLVDVQGRIVKSIITDKSSNLLKTIDMSDLAKGLYLLKVTQADKIFVKKIVKN